MLLNRFTTNTLKRLSLAFMCLNPIWLSLQKTMTSSSDLVINLILLPLWQPLAPRGELLLNRLSFGRVFYPTSPLIDKCTWHETVPPKFLLSQLLDDSLSGHKERTSETHLVVYRCNGTKNAISCLRLAFANNTKSELILCEVLSRT